MVDATCFGDADGSYLFQLRVVTGIQLSMESHLLQFHNITGLTAATYYVTITDSKNCIGIDSFKSQTTARISCFFGYSAIP